jgi:hypothetical protein
MYVEQIPSSQVIAISVCLIGVMSFCEHLMRTFLSFLTQYVMYSQICLSLFFWPYIYTYFILLTKSLCFSVHLSGFVRKAEKFQLAVY